MKADDKPEKTPTLYLGDFDSERFWRDPGASQLPSIPQAQDDAIVAAMDELQFVFCEDPEDVLITRLPMDLAHKEYLADIGITFPSNELPVRGRQCEKPLEYDKSICQLLAESPERAYFRKLLPPLSKLSAHSAVPFTDNMCSVYRLLDPSSDYEIVRKVNSKAFSHGLSKRLFENRFGETVNSAQELDTRGRTWLQSSSVLIKEEFGVSGKGSLLIKSEYVLERIVKYLAEQEEREKKTRLVIEPLLDKDVDFSCQFEIDVRGRVTMSSIQQMQNSGFAFSGIRTADEGFREKLEASGYYGQVAAVAAELYREGYSGPVCLDSMILRSGEIVPVVEINARKSMGLINQYVDKFLSRFSAHGAMKFLSLGLPRDIGMNEVLGKMRRERILFLKEKPNGILPLSANTLNANLRSVEQRRSGVVHRGRLYVSVVSESAEQEEGFLSAMRSSLGDLGIRLLN
jgi:hypothetical protein